MVTASVVVGVAGLALLETAGAAEPDPDPFAGPVSPVALGVGAGGAEEGEVSVLGDADGDGGAASLVKSPNRGYVNHA